MASFQGPPRWTDYRVSEQNTENATALKDKEGERKEEVVKHQLRQLSACQCVSNKAS